ncbi:7740_t:CDS:2 [Dentiscutata heterogama]|uniref:7740_t:CDS:1 n=1 Tax=Dentiscutata heterogama TaxID=1316150 RepID=A0ACA9JWN2_9GLOM|nr:7740_t:CDS:2 [Dentiscutata heterogama]
MKEGQRQALMALMEWAIVTCHKYSFNGRQWCEPELSLNPTHEAGIASNRESARHGETSLRGALTVHQAGKVASAIPVKL